MIEQCGDAPLVGLATIVVIALIVALAVALFRGGFTETVPVTVISQRAGLVMNPDAKVKMRGVQVGKVSVDRARARRHAALHLAMDPSQLHLIPANVARRHRLDDGVRRQVRPADAAGRSVRATRCGPVRCSEPARHRRDQHGLPAAGHGAGQDRAREAQRDPRRDRHGVQRPRREVRPDAADFDTLLAKIEPSLPNLSHDLEAAVPAVNAYADAAPDLVVTVENTTTFSDTIVDEQQNLDALLVSAIGLADIGNDVLGGNRQALTDVLHLLVPTTDLLNEYHDVTELRHRRPGAVREVAAAVPGVMVSAGLTLGVERYRYPGTCPRSRPQRRSRTARSSACPMCRRTSCRRSWSPTSAPTRRSTATRASC